ncbi:MAG: UDP-N-acetylglucosamine--N-acetylmuramyl-(pentapeptide) pyrophosphoryl-undecaprenol N-acetylglucosamine transferase, partial [Chlamydiia bacterium]|nr:UDP-N-acetylglucosamine--N-acetylmuramyl-(pentapeptide) pyrophosphoryl-undecaprenol N-acetylglucosamine transferase [Chlamydiia bacterium]
MNKCIKVVIAAGGSGGHLFPAQQLAQELVQKGNCQVLFAGYKLDQSPFFDREKTPFAPILAAPLMARSFPMAFLRGFVQSVRCIRQFNPSAIVGFGSYHVFPVLSAAACLRKKLILFEANCALGKVNRFFRPFAQAVAWQFPQETKKTVAVPLLPWRLTPSSWESTSLAKKAYGLQP